jgi:hypothetical protein
LLLVRWVLARGLELAVRAVGIILRDRCPTGVGDEGLGRRG